MSDASRPFADTGRFRHVVALLGGFRLLRGQKVVSLPRASQRLLAFLALNDAVVIERTAIVGALWPDVPEERAHSNLRSALSRLQRVAPESVAASKAQLRLADDVTVDVRHARSLARLMLDPTSGADTQDLGMATIDALSAEILPGWYDDWVVAEAEDWRQLRIHALEAVAHRLLDVGQWGAAASAARSAVRAEPLRESGQAALIRVHLAQGNQAEALRQFASYRAQLKRDLGLEPTPQLRQLLAAVPGAAWGAPGGPGVVAPATSQR